MLSRINISTTLATFLACCTTNAAEPLGYADIQPILQAKCAKCHGDKNQKADLNLSTFVGVLKGGESGKVVVPGDAKKSLLFEKVHDGSMPPKKEERLSEADVKKIEQWIANGAKASAADTTTANETLNQHDVIPIMMQRCTVCHGRHRQEGGLDLRTRASMVRGGKSGTAIVPGKVEASLLIKKIKPGQMPPRDKLIVACVKPVEPSELDILEKWIVAGAPEVPITPDIATTTPDPLVTDKDRDFWAFKPPAHVIPPTVKQRAQVRNPIDAFILQKLEAKGLTFAPEADRATLLRRAYIDLLGLPPSPAEVKDFLADTAPNAYERLIERLLSSPQYGERGGRHWLDLAGYADSEGKREQDLPRPHAWRYRDYVIRSLNDDKPYDRFLLEQLAGDELADYERAKEITPALYDNLVATGFLRMAPDPTWANITGFVPDRLEVISDEMDILGSGIMGLTMKCARCHTHKFDPIPQRDYYRLLAIFKGALDEHDWLKPEIRPGIGPISEDFLTGRMLPFVSSDETRTRFIHNATVQTMFEAVNRTAGKQTLEQVAARTREWDAKKLPEPKIHALWDRGEPSPTYIYRRGNPLTSGKLVGPGVPSMLTDGKTPFDVRPPWPEAKKTGARLAFAKWLTQPDHPLTARVAVNRIWKFHFGNGIVPTLGNFGKAGLPPTHPELLDWLARELVARKWSVKEMHRLMMTSATYRQRSAVTTEHERLDPSNALYSRMPLVRLDAESLYDSLLLVAGRLDLTAFGPADSVQVRGDGLVTPKANERGWRRLIYVQQMRKQMPTHLENFDFPQMNPNCLERRMSTVAPQALHLMNNGMVEELAGHFARRVMREAGSDLKTQAERALWIAYAREPDVEQMKIAVDSLRRLVDEWTKRGAKGDDANMKALSNFCHALMNSAGFLYVD